ncbi:ribosomal RNA-processing protein 8 [Kwoniella heveanensis CBS 569]|nr:ribosomal RNA-processing protein 8 [Kwoniella heveanensis CBS 569]
MSLFPSAFDTGSAAGPSKGFSKSIPKTNTHTNPNSSSTKSNKRKRPSNAGDVSVTGGRANPSQGDLIKSTQANLEKLMSKIERGDFKEKGADGREGMGLGLGMGTGQGSGGAGQRAKKNKQQQQNEGGAGAGAVHGKGKGPRGSDTPRSKEKKGSGHASATSPAKTGGGTGTPNTKTAKPTKGKSDPSKNSSTPTSTSTKAMAKGNTNAAQTQTQTQTQAFEPFELPIPSLSSGKVSVGGDVAGMTDMQRSMQAKLEGAKFRWINEQLYSTPSTDAVAMMKKDPKIFADYHNTHRLLTAVWPSPPLPYIVKALSPLPVGTVIADLGCGDAGLARALVPQGKVVLSYDLVGDSGVPNGDESTGQEKNAEAEMQRRMGGWVVEADFLEKVPLPGRPGGLNYGSSPSYGTAGGEESGSCSKKSNKKSKGKNGNGNATASEVVDVVVCCLSLMGVNWVGGIAEACRILKQGGTLHVAEVTSRFISTEAFVEKVESFGFTLEEQDSPSTHFTLFRFTKQSEVPLGPARGEKGWRERVEEGEGILRGCVYKKR